MKKIVGLIVSLAMVNGLAIADHKAAASFVAQRGSSIQVIIDGRVMNSQPKSTVSIVGRPGVHSVGIKIFDRHGRYSGYHHDQIVVQSGFKIHFALFQRKREAKLVKIKMEPYSRKRYKNPDYYYRDKHFAILDSREIDQIKRAMEHKHFDEDKYSVVVRALDHRYLHTDEVIGLIRQFRFEETKLKFAKMAYHHTVDKHSYYLIYDEFKFRTSLDELDYYLNGY